ncbi:MAG: tyrosine-type recombinase/integrase [Oscillospiraceae bacterium]|nr:tyrosine-type recombinase/integrase [Oscillospiraceae bacterium]
MPEFFINEFLNIRNSCIYNKDRNFIATNKNGDNLSCSSISHSFHYYINKYNLPHITLKGLRHTCATIISNSGFNLKYVQEWLGHSTITITANTYTHINMSDKKKVAYTLDNN